MKLVRADGVEIARFAPLRDHQCKVTMHVFRKSGGRIPDKLAKLAHLKFLAPAEHMRELFQRDDEIDSVERDELAGVVEHEPQVYDAEEEQHMAHVQDKLGGLREENYKELDSQDHRVKMHSIHVEKSSMLVLRASTVRPQLLLAPFSPMLTRLSSADRRCVHLRGGRVGDGQDEQGEYEGARRVRGP